MRRSVGRSLAGIALILSAGTVTACRSASPEVAGPVAQSSAPSEAHQHVGMWVTADGHIRQELRADGRYDEARGERRSAYTGRYEVRGDHIDYWDDSGFTADGRFDGDVLHHGGYLFYRENSEAHRRARSPQS
ncbi:Atu4866 domain-containing protein [Actinoplanes sp. M2I2]|uniref:Atu4866 domain-containing protein n=1 Tax=Actinoplanes sp. M2I2 TaxID=1734444 RepID=UPI002022564D|nr:Atu4866 domain-containing protein [Actinoplanes sp. M2I2]